MLNPLRSLALFWFFAFGALGVFFPFISLYLRDNAGLGGFEVGLSLALFPLVGLIAQPAWGQLADRTGARSRILALVAAGAALGYAVMPFARGLGPVAAAIVLLATFSTAMVPLAVAVSLASLSELGAHSFGQLRVWGSIGFLAGVSGLPVVLDHLRESTPVAVEAVGNGPAEPNLSVMFTLAAGLSLVAAVIALTLPRRGATAMRATRDDWRSLAHNVPYLRLLMVAFAAFLFSQGPMVFFPVFIRSLGGNADTISRLWLVMLVVEIPLILWSGAAIRRIGARGLLIIGVLAAGVRWTLCAVTTSYWLLIPTQLLHGLVVTGILLGGPMYIEQAVPPKLRATGQSVFSMVGLGLGGAISNALSGWLIDHSATTTPYLLGGIGSLILAVAMPRLLPRIEGP